MTWKQRYYVVDTFWDRKEGPNFLYICGEGTCRRPSEESFVGVLAKIFKGRILALEHRFYGMSHPVQDWSTENLRFLSADQGLEDLAYFASVMSHHHRNRSESFAEENGEEGHHHRHRRHHSRRWIMVGGSYPGALSAWFRYKYPHIAMGALSSSGVVNAIEDYYMFDVQM